MALILQRRADLALLGFIRYDLIFKTLLSVFEDGRQFIYVGAGLAYLAPKFKLNPKNRQN